MTIQTIRLKLLKSKLKIQYDLCISLVGKYKNWFYKQETLAYTVYRNYDLTLTVVFKYNFDSLPYLL